jgi:hypothetical protein
MLVIQTASENYDEITANSTLTELKQKRWPRPVKALLDKIAEYMLHSDFEEAVKCVKDHNETK